MPLGEWSWKWQSYPNNVKICSTYKHPHLSEAEKELRKSYIALFKIKKITTMDTSKATELLDKAFNGGFLIREKNEQG
jgi:hypothetical protein